MISLMTSQHDDKVSLLYSRLNKISTFSRTTHEHFRVSSPNFTHSCISAGYHNHNKCISQSWAHLATLLRQPMMCNHQVTLMEEPWTIRTTLSTPLLKGKGDLEAGEIHNEAVNHGYQRPKPGDADERNEGEMPDRAPQPVQGHFRQRQGPRGSLCTFSDRSDCHRLGISCVARELQLPNATIYFAPWEMTYGRYPGDMVLPCCYPWPVMYPASWYGVQLCPDMAWNNGNFACPGGWSMPYDYYPNLAASNVHRCLRK